MKLEYLIDEKYILGTYEDFHGIRDSEDLTDILWEFEKQSGNEFNLNPQSYNELVEPIVKKIWEKNNLISK
jgi:hypothetical protein